MANNNIVVVVVVVVVVVIVVVPEQHILGKLEIKELQKTAILGTIHTLRKVLM
jgi:hypothetical protein